MTAVTSSSSHKVETVAVLLVLVTLDPVTVGAAAWFVLVCPVRSFPEVPVSLLPQPATTSIATSTGAPNLPRHRISIESFSEPAAGRGSALRCITRKSAVVSSPEPDKCRSHALNW
jgi:hypothetical protein